MQFRHFTYTLVEAVLGRARSWRIGRWLYKGARRELLVDPDVDGEFALQRAWAMAQARGTPGTTLMLMDVGANLGVWSTNAIKELDRSGIVDFRIRAFEPSSGARGEIGRLCAAELADGKLIIDNRGVAASPGRAAFSMISDTGGSNGLANLLDQGSGVATVEIELTTLDAVCEAEAITHLHLVKVDTEGNDFNVILGAAGLFDREAIDVLQFEYNWRWIGFGRWLRDVFEFMKSRPYVIGRLTPSGVEQYETWHPELERYIETNYVIAHRSTLDWLPHWRAHIDESNVTVRSK